MKASYDFCRKNKAVWVKTLVAAMLITLAGCSGKPRIPDVSKITVELKVRRFDQDLLALRKDSVTWAAVQKLQQVYPDFTTIYFERIADLTPLDDSSCVPLIRDFLFDPDITLIYDEVGKQYANLDDVVKNATQAFRFYKYHFPRRPVPSLTTYVFGFNYAAVATDSSVCMALDQYLGSGFRYYEHLPDYIRYRKDKAFLVSDMMRAWATTEFESPQPRTDLLDEMIFQGKIQYFLDQVLPYEHDSILMGYSGAQVKFCDKNEYQIWSYFVENKLLYSKDFTMISKYCGEAPFSPGMPRESPGRTGIWTGWQIVKSFMKRNKKITLEQLMENHNYKQILEMSRYKPKR